MPALTDHDLESLGAQFAQWGHKPAHAQRLLRRFYEGHGWADLSTLHLGASLVRRIDSELPLRQSRIIARTVAADGTLKLLVELASGGAVEAVLMPSHRADRAAGCVSSQVGCAMGCDFCASTKRGLERHLSAGEIVEQFLHLRREAAAQDRRLATLVFMGIGEPMHNLDAVIAAIRRISSRALGQLGVRRITVSTVGIAPGIDRLAESGLGVALAVSLHAPDDATRDRLVPMNRRWSIGQIMAAARRYQQRTGRIVNIEYCLLAGINDSGHHAVGLADLMDGFRAHVNLIPCNPIGAGAGGVEYRRPAPERMAEFLAVLRGRGVVAHLRQPRGDDVAAACGQLRGNLSSAIDVPAGMPYKTPHADPCFPRVWVPG